MTKNASKYIFMNWILALVSFIFAGYFFLNAPESVPIHFDLTGNTDAYGSKTNLFMFPGLVVGLNMLTELLKRIDPRRENFKRFEKQFYLIIFVINLFLLFNQVAIGSYILNWINQLPSYLEGSLGILFIILGNYMPKIKQNYFMGIRTPWALANENVWYLTHRFGGKVFVVMGLLLMINTFLPPLIKHWTFLIITLGGIVVICIASYWFFKRNSINRWDA